MSTYTSIARFVTPNTTSEIEPVDPVKRPGHMVVRINDVGVYLTIHLDADTADAAERIGHAFMEAAAAARRARAGAEVAP